DQAYASDPNHPQTTAGSSVPAAPMAHQVPPPPPPPPNAEVQTPVSVIPQEARTKLGLDIQSADQWIQFAMKAAPQDESWCYYELANIVSDYYRLLPPDRLAVESPQLKEHYAFLEGKIRIEIHAGRMRIAREEAKARRIQVAEHQKALEEFQRHQEQQRQEQDVQAQEYDQKVAMEIQHMQLQQKLEKLHHQQEIESQQQQLQEQQQNESQQQQIQQEQQQIRQELELQQQMELQQQQLQQQQLQQQQLQQQQLQQQQLQQQQPRRQRDHRLLSPAPSPSAD
ncbi:hypothetical protein BGZ95_004873, partial [Linnemannia exigua]